MKHSLQAAAAAATGLLCALAPSLASAKVLELGATSTPLVVPKCPPGVDAAHCTILLTRVTALETIRDGVAYPTKVKQAGKIVAFTLGLSRLSSSRTLTHNFIHLADVRYGGVPQASITVLRPVGKAIQRRWMVKGESPTVHLIPFLGQVAQFWLSTPLSVEPGDAIALTVPTWAPIISYELTPTKFAYRQSRSANCSSAGAFNQAQLVLNTTTGYGCDYPGARVEYSATEITDPVPTKNYVHAPDR